MVETKRKEPSFLVSLVSGGIAGTTVDVALYPLDTIKTRLQAPQGFITAGGFRGVYKGLSAAAAGSAPGAALFFSTYEMSKQILHDRNSSSSSGYQIPQPAIHMIAASTGEMVCNYLNFYIVQFDFTVVMKPIVEVGDAVNFCQILQNFNCTLSYIRHISIDCLHGKSSHRGGKTTYADWYIFFFLCSPDPDDE